MIISILGIAGGKVKQNSNCQVEEKSEKVKYKAQVLNLKDGEYHNSLHFLLENYKSIGFGEKFICIGTKCAINFQKELLAQFMEGRDIEFIEVRDDSLDEIFENILTILENRDIHEKESTLIDITHGFRHQPIMAIFASALSNFINSFVVDILFAKEIKSRELYEYIFLDDYIKITQLSFLLTGFIKTLNFIDNVKVDKFDTSAFQSFSQGILSNDFNKISTSYKALIQSVKLAKENPKFKHLNNLFEEVEEILKVFEGFENKSLYSKYLILAKLIFEKHYYLPTLTYIFEALRIYSSKAFYKNELITKKYYETKNRYKINSDVIFFINQENFQGNYKKGYYDKNFPTLYEKNRDKFIKVSTVYEELRELRNTLTHIGSANINDIDKQLNRLIQKVEEIITEDTLKDLKM